MNDIAAACVLHDPAQFEHGVPHAALAALRRESALVWVEEPALPDWPEGPGYWLVLRHAEVGHVLKHPELFSSSLGGTQLRDPGSNADLQYVQKMMLNMDPPEHTRLRRLLQNAFTSRALDQLKERIEQHAKNLVDKALAGATHSADRATNQFDDQLATKHSGEPDAKQHSKQGQCDFARDIAADMPLLSLADILGMPAEDRYLMFDWANRVIGFQDPEYARSAAFDVNSGSAMAREALALRPSPDANGRMPDPRSRGGMPDLYHYAHLLGASKRQHPRDDVMSLLMSSMSTDEPSMSLEEFENMFWLFSVAGNETVRNGLPGGMIALLDNPDQWQVLKQDPSLLPSAVDEMLRWWTPVMVFRRTAVSDTVLAGQEIKQRQKVVVSFTSANRDERVYEQEDAFMPRRTHNPHFALGYGPHYCLGAQFAKAQMVAIFKRLLERCSSIEAAAPPVFLRSNFQRGVKSLPLNFTLEK